MNNTAFDQIFRDSNGEIVIAQPPNPPLVLWLAATLLRLVVTKGTISTLLEVVAFGSIFTWAWLELFQGVNYFRRGLGLVVLISAIAFRTASLNALGSLI